MITELRICASLTPTAVTSYVFQAMRYDELRIGSKR